MKKGFTFIISAIAAVLFLFLLILFYFTQIDAAGESRVIVSACGEDAQYCLTTPELEMVAFLKTPYTTGAGQVVSMGDALALAVLPRGSIDLGRLQEAIDIIYEGDCVYVRAHDGEELISTQRVGGSSDCERLGAFNYAESAVYVKNDLVVSVAVGRSNWEIAGNIATYLGYRALTTTTPVGGLF